MPVTDLPHAAILSMEAILKPTTVFESSIAIRYTLNISLTFNHRIVDGLTSGRIANAAGAVDRAAGMGTA
jgi:2-oxoisovalerate dehydrogenase E2 component (dihydrolipoyl transacylase)